MTEPKAKPFLKWAGGKTQLLPTIESYLPENFRNERAITYIEPFVGGGAMLFFMLQKYGNIRKTIINDINPRLINAYLVVRDKPTGLIGELRAMQDSFRAITTQDARKEFYLDIRQRFNHMPLTDVEQAAYMIFLNRTCFNGLYRENIRGEFNVPFGRYANPKICDAETIMADSRILQDVEILNGDFSTTGDFVHGYTFFYFDPPYRPLDATSSFNSYVKNPFGDSEQFRLKEFYAAISHQGCHELLSNSDGRARNEDDLFFDNLYGEFIIERVNARRSINANASKRGLLSELLIRNYENCQGHIGSLAEKT